MSHSDRFEENVLDAAEALRHVLRYPEAWMIGGTMEEQLLNNLLRSAEALRCFREPRDQTGLGRHGLR